MNPSRHDRFRRLARRCLPSVAAMLAIACAVHPPPTAGQTAIEGEYGLRVTHEDGEIGVGWLTSSARPGALRVFAGSAVLLDVETPSAGAHYVTFPRPSTDVELRYGAAGGAELNSTVLYVGPEPPPESGELRGVDSLFVVGDIHGEYDHLRQLLTNAGLVDGDAHWVGGTRHVVFLGDLFDRGPDVTRVLWFVYRLEREARRAGGGAHVVLGNHETMVFTRDLRYVMPKEQLIAVLHGVSYTEMFDIRTSVLGRWLATRPGLMRIDGALLAHGGVSAEIEPHSVAALNDSVRAYIAEDLFYRWADPTFAFANDSATAEAARDEYADVIVIDSASVARRMALLFDESSIFWYRGYMQSNALGAELDRVLRSFDAELHVVAHTPVPSIASRYDGKLLAVDMEDPAIEMLLLTKDDEGRYRKFRFGLTGEPEPL